MFRKLSIIVLCFFLFGFTPEGGWDTGMYGADNISVNTDNFDQNLDSTDNTVQSALETLDELIASGGASTNPTDGYIPVANNGVFIDSSIYNDGTNVTIYSDIYINNNGTITGYTSQYPPTQSDTYVKATNYFTTSYYPHFATDPTKSLTGSWTNNSWITSAGTYTNQRFHIDLGSAKIITKIYYENIFDSIDPTLYSGCGVQNFTFWGSNNATAFSTLTYATDTNWTQLTTDQSTMDRHTASNIADPKYIEVTNTTSYRYYAVKAADTWTGATCNRMGLRRIELQTADIEATPSIEYQGSEIKISSISAGGANNDAVIIQDADSNILVTVDQDGNVGIGTTSPTEKLDVDGNIIATAVSITGGASSQFLKADGSTDSAVYWKADGTSTATGNWHLGAYGMDGDNWSFNELGEATFTTLYTPVIQDYSFAGLPIKNSSGTTVATFGGALGSTLTTFEGRVLYPVGTVSAPSIYFANQANSGIYSSGAGVIDFSTYSVNKLSITGGAVNATVPFRASDGTATAPSHSFTNNTNTGMYLVSTNNLGFATNGVARMILDVNGQLYGPSVFAPGNGTASTPSFGFLNDPNTGMYRIGADIIGFTAGGAEVARIDSTGIKTQFVGSQTTTTLDLNGTLRADASSGSVSIGMSASPDNFNALYVDATGFGGSAGYFTDGTNYAYLADFISAGYFSNSTGAYVRLAGTGVAGEFYDGTNTVYLADGTNPITVNGSAGYTGDLNDSTATKIADVVGGIITAVYY